MSNYTNYKESRISKTWFSVKDAYQYSYLVLLPSENPKEAWDKTKRIMDLILEDEN